MQKITPHLWFDKEAKEAAEFYTSIFPNSSIKSVQTINNTPSGDAHVVSFNLNGQDFMAISAGPYFKFTEAISFIINCEDQAEIDYYWDKLSAHPESEQCGWLKDKYGLSWQVIPTKMNELLARDTSKTVPAMLKMKKIVIAELETA